MDAGRGGRGCVYGHAGGRERVPEGRYRFLARTVKMFGDETKETEWNMVWLDGFELRYRSGA